MNHVVAGLDLLMAFVCFMIATSAYLNPLPEGLLGDLQIPNNLTQ